MKKIIICIVVILVAISSADCFSGQRVANSAQRTANSGERTEASEQSVGGRTRPLGGRTRPIGGRTRPIGGRTRPIGNNKQGAAINNNACDDDSIGFVGVWTPAEDTWMKKIKITYSKGKYTVQLKTEEGIKSFTDLSCENNSYISWSYYDDTEYGEWRLRHSRNENPYEVPIVDRYGSIQGIVYYSTNFHYHAKYRKIYMVFVAYLHDGNLEVKYGLEKKYYDSSDHLLFTSIPNYGSPCIFTNW